MHRILYISTARTLLDPDQLATILGTSRRNNLIVDVTGLLVVGGRRFLQALEGPKDAVAATFERIARDPRHFAIVKLNESTVGDRVFGGWSMGFETSGDTAVRGTLDDQVAGLIAGISDANLRANFQGFVRTHTTA